MLILRTKIALCISIAAIAGCGSSAKPAADSTVAAAPAATDTAADMKAIRDVNVQWFAKHNAHDAAGVTALYADDAELMMPGIPLARGHDAIRSAYDADIASMTKDGLTQKAGTAPEFGMSGDLAWESNAYIVQDKTGKQVDVGKYLSVFQKKDGKWLLIRDTWNSDAPPPKA